MVAISTIIAMTVDMILGLVIPVVLYFVMKKRFGNHRIAFFVGCGIMLVFAFVLESLVHQVVLGSSLGMTIQGNIWLYGLYGASMAAIFEETGRLVAFKFFLKKHRENNSTALFYGAGHGGFEAFYLLFASGINNLIFAAMINAGDASALTVGLEGAALVQIESAIDQMLNASWTLFLLSPIERIAAVILHISLSVLVWFGIKNGNYKWYGLALLFHFLMDFVAVISNNYLSSLGMAGTVVVEVIIWIFAVAIAFYTKKVWNKYHDQCIHSKME